MDEGLTITELARRTGLTAQLLRSYERAGLLAPDGAGATNGASGTRKDRQGNGRRRYTEADLARFRLLGRLRATGMTPAEVREFAELGGPGADTAQRRRDVLMAHRRRVLARIDQLHEDLALIEYQIQQFDRPGGSLRQPPRDRPSD